MAFVNITPSNNNNSTSPSTLLFTGGNTTSNTIIVMVAIKSSTDIITGITDTEGNTYTKLATATDSDGTATSLRDFWIAPVTAGSSSNNTVSVAFTSGTAIFCVAAEYSGLNNASILDSSNHGGGAINTVSYTVTAAAAGETLITFLSQTGGGVNYSALSGTARTGVSSVNLVVMDAISVLGSNTISSFVNTTGQASFTVALKAAPSVSGNGNNSIFLSNTLIRLNTFTIL